MEQFSQMEEALIAAWVGGDIRGDSPDDDMIHLCFYPEFETGAADAERRFRSLRDAELFDFLQEHFCTNRDCACFVKKIEDFMTLRFNTSSCNGTLRWGVAQAVDMMIEKLRHEPPTMQSILERFEATFADDPSEPVLGLATVLAELKLAPGWADWVEEEHFGSEVDACERLQEMWDTATQRSGGRIDIESFMQYFRKMLDDR